jgi:hypothetical protein
MTDQEEQLANFREHTMDALRKIPYCRWYAVEEDQAVLDSLSLLGIAWHTDRFENQNGKRFNAEEYRDFLQEVVDHVDCLRQEIPEAPPKMPSVWRDEITGEVPKNPWSNPPDLDSQGAVMERDPELASWLKETASGVSYKLLAKQQKKAEARLRKSAIRHGKAEWQTNPFRDKSNLQAQADFIKQFGQEVADYYRHEAETPIKLPWAIGSQNKTEIGQIVKKSPEIARMVFRASELLRQRLTKEAAEAKQQAEEARQRQIEIERKLRSK